MEEEEGEAILPRGHGAELYHAAAKGPGPKVDLQNGSKDVLAQCDNE